MVDDNQEVLTFLRKYSVRMLGFRSEAGRLSRLFEPTEQPLDVCKASFVKKNGKPVGKGSGFVMVILTSHRVIVEASEFLSFPLNEISELSPLENGRFTWRYKGTEWEFTHAIGLIRRNGNKENTDRFYASLSKQLAPEP